MDKENHLQKVSVVIPCLNEAATIAALVTEFALSPLVGEIIVVDDASTDATNHQARAAGATVYTLDRKHGKGGAMNHGVLNSQFPTVPFVDGDMSGLSPGVVKDIVTPVTAGNYDMYIGIRRRNSIFLNPVMRFLPLLSGLRAVKKQFWTEIPARTLDGFGIETVLNYFARHYKCKMGYTVVSGIHHKTKEDKYGLIVGFRRRLVMIMQVCVTYWRLYFLHQLYSAVCKPLVNKPLPKSDSTAV